ncbi:MAG: 3-dehydroquinate synthase [Anaerolineae bacterium]|jgi:shikimate kinase/3-dehydroquinate synthase|nr:3-dehydroquinate synthase [Chloroflexota bacterium]
MIGNDNLILTGFMGTGKTSVASRIAQRLGRPFVDMDDEIVERMGKSIPQIFEQMGEQAFRALESSVCVDLSQRSGMVIATGGGCLVDEANRDTLSSSGLVVCLDCEAQTIVQRLQGAHDRPMLYGDSPDRRIRELMAARRQAYARIPYHIDTTHRTIDQVVEEVIRLYKGQPQVYPVKTPTSGYPVHLIAGGLGMLGDLLSTAKLSSSLVLVTDEDVGPLWADRAVASLEYAGYHVTPIVVPAGEEHKRLRTVAHLYDRFAAAGMDRGGAVIALGGGVITDMAGFAAATYLRGVPLVQVPTTLLGMIDASVGGKVAVDLPQGKNLVGAFVEPLLVLIDPEVLETLPDELVRAGLAEIIKAGVIADPALFARLEQEASLPAWNELIGPALQVKIDVVEQDPYEHGRRAVLNLGHTFAHAYEVLEDFGLAHGLAVSMGMVRAALLAENCGLCSAETRARIIAALRLHGLPVEPPPLDPERVYAAMQMDKKKRSGRIKFVLPRAIGDVTVVDNITQAQVIQALTQEVP